MAGLTAWKWGGEQMKQPHLSECDVNTENKGDTKDREAPETSST